MVNNGKSWKRNEETRLKSRVGELIQSGIEHEAAFITVAEELGRTARGCRDRWNIIYKRRTATKISEVRTHEYTEIFQNLTNALAEVNKVIPDLIDENIRLKQRVAQLEPAEKSFIELKNYFLREKDAG